MIAIIRDILGTSFIGLGAWIMTPEGLTGFVMRLAEKLKAKI